MSIEDPNTGDNDKLPQVPEDEQNLGLAGNMARSFIHSPITPLLLVACLVIGVMGLLITPRQEDPQISVPMVDIFVQYPGASATQVASLVADPLQRIMSELTGVKHVYSASLRDGAMVTVEFDVGEDLESSLVKLYDKLESNMDKIPPGVSPPMVKPKAVDDVPVVTLTLWSSEVDDATLNLIALDVLQRLNEIPNTSQGFVVHGRTEQVRVEVHPEVLEGYGVTLGQIAQTVSAANSERGVGDVEYSGQTFNLYTGAFLQTKEDVEQLVLGMRDGRPVYVRDVADVMVGPSETHSLVRFYTGAAYSGTHVAYGESAVTLAIAKKKGSNGVTVAEDILNKMEYLKGRIIPDNVMVTVTRNYGETARDKVNELLFKLFVATAAVAVLVIFFLGFRAATVVVIVIPVVILVTVFSAWLLGYTIDRVSLFALIFSIGILVDDAIVVVENIYRRWLEKGDMDTFTSVDAVREVGNPTILATFTVIAALLPMGFVTGMMGPYMEPIPALGSVAMLFSLFAAFMFTPWLAMRLKPSMEKLEKDEVKERRQNERLGGFYRRLLVPLITNRLLGYGFLISVIVVFFLCMVLFYSTDVRVKMLPLDNKPEFNVVINMPEGTALAVTANIAHEMSEKLRQIDEVTAVQTYVGTASPFNFNGLVRHYYLRDKPWMGDIQVMLLHKTKRARTSHEIAVQAREMLKPIAELGGARVQVVEMPPGPPVLQSVVAEIYGPSASVRRQTAEELTELFEQAKSIDDVDNYLEADFEMWHFEVNREKALRLGISVDEINSTLEMAMGGFVLGDVKTQSLLEPTLIVLQLPLAIRSDLSRLTQLPVMTPTGTMVPLAELGDFHASIQDKPIYMKDLRPLEYVTGESVGRLAAPIYGMLEVEERLKSYTAPDGVGIAGEFIGPPADSHQSGFEWAGEWTVTYETFRDMGIAFVVALVLIYMLVVWEFGNFTLPAIVMAPIPLTLIGIIPGHWLLDAEFTATSMIGFIALAGIIVRNSILLVDFAKHEIARGVNIVEAVIKACRTRTRPIIITAFALVAGSSVILFDPIFQGMAVSLLFGVLVSTLLTLVIIPLGCVSGRKAFGVEEPPIEISSGEAAAVLPGGERPATVSGDSNQFELRSKVARILSFTSTAVSLLLYLLKKLILGAIAFVGAVYNAVARMRRKRAVADAAPAHEPDAEVGLSYSRTTGKQSASAESARATTASAAKATSTVTESTAAAMSRPVPARRRPAATKEVVTRSKTSTTKRSAETTPASVEKVRMMRKPQETRRSPTQKKAPIASKATAPTSDASLRAKQKQASRSHDTDDQAPAQTPSVVPIRPKQAGKAAKKKGRRGIRLKTDLNDR
jgi:multidrug efflux pump subunit AcrB